MVNKSFPPSSSTISTRVSVKAMPGSSCAEWALNSFLVKAAVLGNDTDFAEVKARVLVSETTLDF